MKHVHLRNPSEWIRNIQLMDPGDDLPHRMAFTAFDRNDEQVAGFLKSFRLTLEDGERLDNDIHAVKVIQELASGVADIAAREFQNTEYMTVLIVHDALDTATDILPWVELGIKSKGFDIAAAIVTDNVKWLDMNEFRSGEVDMNVITDYQLERILNGDDNITTRKG